MTIRIPKVIHRIWFGGEIPDEPRRFGATWLAQNPGWTMHTWREWDLPPLRNQGLFDDANSQAARADLARYEILLRFGGVYVDTDFEALAGLDTVLDEVECFAASEDGRWVSTGIIGAVPHHPFFEELVAELPRSLAAGANKPPNQVSGPYFVTRQLERFRAEHGESKPVVVFPPELFYPYHFSEPERRHDRFDGAVAVHHWAHSWAGS